MVYNANGQATSETVVQRQGNDTITSYVNTDYGYGTGYALGQTVSVATSNYRNGNYQSYTTTSNSFAWYAGAVTSSIAYNDGQGHTYTTSYYYGSGGVLNSVYVADGRAHTIAFTNDMTGQALRRDESDYNYNSGDPHEVWYRFDGRQLGYTGNNGTLDTDYQSSIASRTQAPGTGAFRGGQSYGGAHAEFDGQVTQITSYAQGSGGGSYTVRGGESLSSIAANLWGDASLWYKLASTNGLGADSQLTAGQVLNIPSGVQRASRNAGTFKPFDPSEVIGDTSPTTPQPQAASPRKKNKCGVFDQILVTIVSVAVTAIATPFLGPLAPVSGNIAGQVFGMATGIKGSIDHGEGILNNELYIGRRIFNRRTWVEVPNATRGFTRRPQLNPRSDWIVRNNPDLRLSTRIFRTGLKPDGLLRVARAMLIGYRWMNDEGHVRVWMGRREAP